ncbi:MAG: hypothetical protein AAGI53_11725 [Planctomycetota bacterium]
MRSRRGVGLLLVLAVLVVSTTAALTMARQAATWRVSRSIDDDASLSRELILGAKPIILLWLTEASSSVIMSPEVHLPATLVSRDAFDTHLGTATVEITAFDQSAMTPWQLAADFDAPVTMPRVDTDVVPGLDLLVDRPDSPVYPQGNASASFTPFGTARVTTPPDTPQGDGPWLGATFATHAIDATNRRRTRRVSWTINVNTAPMWLLEQVLSDTDTNSIDVIRNARANGNSATPPVRSVDFKGTTVSLSARSDRWAIRTDVKLDGVGTSTWQIFVRRGQEWLQEQCLVIAE